MITIHPKAESKIRNESNFEIFKHNDFLCCVQRVYSGHINGYVAVTEDHPLYGKTYSDHVYVADKESIPFNGNYIGMLCHAFSAESETNLVSLDLAINVHGGLTYSRGHLTGIDENVFGKLWWFGFDTAHAGDLRPFQNHIDRQYTISDEEYRDMEYVKEETKKLAEQLAGYANQK